MFLDHFKSACEEKGLKIVPVIEACGGSKGKLDGWKKGKNPDSGFVCALAEYLGVSTDRLLLGKDLFNAEAKEIAQEWMQLDERGKAIIKGEILRRLEKLSEGVSDGQEETASFLRDDEPIADIIEFKQRLPVLGRSAAGTPLDMVRDDYGTVPDRDKGGTFAVIAVGDSMIDVGIKDGDYVVIRQQPTAENGEIVLVAVEDGSTIKRFYRLAKHVELRPCSTKHPVQKYGPRDSFRVLGLVVDVISPAELNA